MNEVGVLNAYCPMGCGQSIEVTGAGVIRCTRVECPRPDALAQILANPETEHLVKVGRVDYVIQHPLRERLETSLFRCPMNPSILRSVDSDLRAEGLYRVTRVPRGELTWTLLGPEPL